MDESIKKIGNLCVELEIELEKITRAFEMKKVDDDHVQVVRADTGEDCALDVALVTTYVSKITDIVGKHREAMIGKIKVVDPDLEKKFEEYKNMK